MDEGLIDRREVGAVVHRVDQLLAHAHQRGSAAGREVEAAEQFLPARLGGDVHLGRGRIGGRCCQPAIAASMRLWSGPKSRASASKKAMRGPVVSSA